MTKRQKRIRKLFQNPKAVTFKELDHVLKSFDFEVRQPGSGSSHYVYTKEIYVKRVLELLGGNDEERS